LFNNGDSTGLTDRINEAEYYNNFVALAAQLAPDGRDLNTVAFTSVSEGDEKSVNLTRTSDFPSPISIEDTNEVIESGAFTGVLKAASATRPTRETITIVDNAGKAHTVVVPSGLADIVRPYWDESVTVSAVRTKRRKWIMKDIHIANFTE
jgi:hypothetical protein